VRADEARALTLATSKETLARVVNPPNRAVRLETVSNDPGPLGA
jgi:hypothetical protein